MSVPAQLERLLAEMRQRGALMDDLAGAVVRLSTVPPYPRLFRELVVRHTFVSFDVGGVRVYSNVKGDEDSLEDLLADKILTRGLVAAGFLPFGRPATGSYDRICFDVRGTEDPDDAPVVLMDHEAILSHNRIPKPKRLGDGLMDLFDAERQKAEQGAPPNSRPPSRLPSSPEVQSSDPLRTPSSGGCG